MNRSNISVFAIREDIAVKKLKIESAILLAVLFTGCSSDDISEDQAQQEPEQAPRGILTNQQRQALDGANSVEQILQDSAEARQKELDARLRAQ